MDAWRLTKVEGYDEGFVEYIDKLILTSSREFKVIGDRGMANSFFKRLGLFQGVLIGIYGNWLYHFLTSLPSQERLVHGL